MPPADLRAIRTLLPAWLVAILMQLRELFRYAKRLRLTSPAARRETAQQELQALAQRPLISIVMPTYRTDLRYLREAVDSVRRQHYPEWELVIVDDGSGQPELERAIAAYAAAEPRIKSQANARNAGISAASNDGLALCSGEFVGFLDHDDTLTDDALLRVAQVLTADPGLDVVYTDSDKLTIKGIRADPFLKPDWSPVYALGAMYIGHLLVVRRSIALAAGGFDTSFDTIQDFEFMLRVSEHTDRIHHIPKILYHWRAIPGSIAAGTDQKSGVEELQPRASSEHLARLGGDARVVAHDSIPHRAVLAPANGAVPATKVSVIVASQRPAQRERLLRSLLSVSSHPDFETIVVSPAEETDSDDRLRRLKLDGAWSRARANNLGAGAASASLLLFLGDEIEMIDRDWIEALVLHAGLPDVGAVGPMVVRNDGKVEQAGFAIGLHDPVAPMLAGFSANGDGYYGSMPCAREVSALSADCMLVEKEAFDRIGGFNELFSREYDDFDLCMRLAAAGSKSIYAPHPRVLSHRGERASGDTDIVDRALFVDLWYDQLMQGDPYFNPNFARRGADYVPAGWREQLYRATAPLGMR
ncbi:MAG TPA: glycosyltransferase [Solirubrobacterales bacterium]|nr:glycosyltransferase [Solirubrobacterales bacterium]